MISQDGETKAELVKKLHQQVKENLEKKNEQTKKYVDKGRKELTFEPGDWVWLHMRTERFPNQRKSKLAPRGDGPFKVLKKINDNAYQIDLPGEFNISSTFNVSELSPFDADESVLRSEPSEGGGNDEDIGTNKDPTSLIPTMRHGPRTRSGTINMREQFNEAVEALISQRELDNIMEKLNKLAITSVQAEGGLHKDPSKIQVQEEGEWPLIPLHKGLAILSISTPK